MASIDRYRPPAREEGYQPQHQQQQQQHLSTATTTAAAAAAAATSNGARSSTNRSSKSPIKRRDIPPAVPTPPSHAHYPPARNSHLSPRSRSRSARSPERPRPATESAARRRMAANQWLFTHDEVNSSPSIAEGMPPAEERLRRAKGVNFIYNVGVMLNLPQLTLYVAGVFFHRFYMRCSMDEKRGIHHYNIAATALFLANKTEENGAKTKNIIIAVAKVAQKNANLIIDEQSKEYWRWRDSILSYEEVMLEYLTFDLSVTHPYQILYKLLEELKCIHNKDLRKSAWAFCNDSCLSVLPLLMEARDVAMASIFFASNFTKQKIPDVDGKPWWIALEGNEERIQQAIAILVDFYKENPLRKPDNPYQGSPGYNFESTRNTGEGSSTNASPRTDNQTQSPEPRSKERANGHSNDEAAANDGAAKGRANGTSSNDANDEAMDIDDSSKGDSFAAPAESQGPPHTGPGDSDIALKEAANDPATHEHTARGDSRNAGGLASPSKRKEHEPLSDENRDQKRMRRDSEEEDEGEVLDE